MSSLNDSRSGLVNMAAALDVHQAARLVDEAEMRIRLPARSPGLGGLVFTVASDKSRERGRDRRGHAIAIARRAISSGTAEQELGAVIGPGRRAIDQVASTWRRSMLDDGERDQFDQMRPASQDAFEWAALAYVGADTISDDVFKTLYGPWWRAVVRGVRPVWVARWSSVSLVGCWLTILGVVLAPFVNAGDAGYATLGIIVTGCAVWGIGALFSTERSRPWPEPTRPTEPTTTRSWPSVPRRLWRLPETAVSKVVGLNQLR